MIPERRAEVNRLLAEFEFPDYCADLNALARLEAKLPPHGWTLSLSNGSKSVFVRLDVLGEEFKPLLQGFESTEAEARAEAVARYLEQRK